MIIEVSTGVAPVVPMINLIGVPSDQVAGRISEFAVEHDISVSWTLVEVPISNPTLNGAVVSTNPPSGEPVVGGQIIVVNIGKIP